MTIEKANIGFDEMLSLANHQVDEAISNALTSLTRILSLPCISLTTTPTLSPANQNSSLSSSSNSLQPNISAIRCRSSSRNSRRERKLPFHHTIPRCSLPATKNDLVHYRSRLLSSQNQPTNIQYSYSLTKPLSTKLPKQRQDLISIQNFANDFIEHAIHSALIQIDDQNLSNSNISISDDDDNDTSYVSTYVDQLICSTIEQSIDDLSFESDENLIEHLSTRLTQTIVNDALANIIDDEKTQFFQQFRKRDSLDTIVNNLAQQIYTDSFDELRR